MSYVSALTTNRLILNCLTVIQGVYIPLYIKTWPDTSDMAKRAVALGQDFSTAEAAVAREWDVVPQHVMSLLMLA